MIKVIHDMWKDWVRTTGLAISDYNLAYRIFEAGALCFAPEIIQLEQQKSAVPEKIVERIEIEMRALANDVMVIKTANSLGIANLKPYLTHFEKQMYANRTTHSSLARASSHFCNWLYKMKDNGNYSESKSEKRANWQEDTLKRIERLARGVNTDSDKPDTSS